MLERMSSLQYGGIDAQLAPSLGLSIIDLFQYNRIESSSLECSSQPLRYRSLSLQQVKDIYSILASLNRSFKLYVVYHKTRY